MNRNTHVCSVNNRYFISKRDKPKEKNYLVNFCKKATDILTTFKTKLPRCQPLKNHSTRISIWNSNNNQYKHLMASENYQKLETYLWRLFTAGIRIPMNFTFFCLVWELNGFYGGIGFSFKFLRTFIEKHRRYSVKSRNCRLKLFSIQCLVWLWVFSPLKEILLTGSTFIWIKKHAKFQQKLQLSSIDIPIRINETKLHQIWMYYQRTYKKKTCPKRWFNED